MSKRFLLTLLVAAACSAPLSAIDRGLGDPKSVYIPKGTVAVSLTGGYNSWKATGEELTQGIALAGVIEDVNGHVNLASAGAGLSWFVADNVSVGARFGYGKMTFEKEMTQYEKFHLDITYRNDRTPTLCTIVTSSSYLGDYFTGGSGSVVYFDEFQFIYY